jgi:YHS domain-containing protein
MKMKTICKKLGVLTLVLSVALLAGCDKKEPAGMQNQTENTAQQTQQAADAAAQTAKDTVPEQTVCPVMGGAINKEIFAEYNGKKVYFCCSDCVAEFKKNPEKYLAKLPQFKE